MRSDILFLALLLATASTPALAQFGQGSASTPDDPAGRSTPASAAGGPVPGDPGYDVLPAGSPRTKGREILEVAQGAVLKLRPGGSDLPETLVVELELPGGGTRQEVARREGGGAWVLDLDTEDLLPGGPEVAVAAFRTTPSRDARVLAGAVEKAAGRGLVPAGKALLLEDLPGEGGRPTRLDYSAGQILDAGGMHRVPFRARAGEREVLTGEIGIAARAPWIYYSGHYPAGEGGSMFQSPVSPDVVSGKEWPETVEALILAACYAGEIAGQPTDGRPVLWGRGVEGARWWEKFRGTLLGYRVSAPTAAAGGVARELVRRAARLRRSEDRRERSRALAMAWMRGNLRIRATYATALDADGTYYYIGRLDRPLACARSVGGGIRAAARECWEGEVADLREKWERQRDAVAALKTILALEYGGRPPEVARALAHEEVREGFRAGGIDPEGEEAREATAAWLTYQEHLFYEVDLPALLRFAAHWIAEREGLDALTVARLREHFTPPRGRVEKPLRRKDAELQAVIDQVREVRGRVRPPAS